MSRLKKQDANHAPKPVASNIEAQYDHELDHRPMALAPLGVAQPYMPNTRDIVPYLSSMEQNHWYSNFGPLTTEFEKRLSSRFETLTHVTTVANATIGLSLVLQALNLTPNSYVALPAWTFAATAHAVLQAGFKPYFVDVDINTHMLDVALCRQLVADRALNIQAIIPVCAFGCPLDLNEWHRFQIDTGIKVIIDAAAAHDIATFAPVPIVVSLHATKALGAGEGGYVATQDAELCTRIRALSNFGFHGSRTPQWLGLNGKMSEYSAAIALASLDNWTVTRLKYQTVAQKIRLGLYHTPQIQFQPSWGSQWISSVCVIHTPSGRAPELADKLKSKGIETRLWWSTGCHMAPPFAQYAQIPLPNTDELARSSLGIPYFAHMTDPQIERMTQALVDAVSSL